MDSSVDKHLKRALETVGIASSRLTYSQYVQFLEELCDNLDARLDAAKHDTARKDEDD